MVDEDAAHAEWLSSLVKAHPSLVTDQTIEASQYILPSGWRTIVEETIEAIAMQSIRSQTIKEIKEKIGVLHVNLSIRNPSTQALIESARAKASVTCGACGGPAPPKEFDSPTCSTCRTTEAKA